MAAQSQPAGDRSAHRPGERRDRAARPERPHRGRGYRIAPPVCAGELGRRHRGGARGAAGGRDRRPFRGGRYAAVRSERRGGANREQQELRQGADAPLRRPDGLGGALRRVRGGGGLPGREPARRSSSRPTASAAGKGVVVAQSRGEALQALRRIDGRQGVRRRGRDGPHRGVPGGAGGERVRLRRRRLRLVAGRRRATTSVSATSTATPVPIPAAWAASVPPPFWTSELERHVSGGRSRSRSRAAYRRWGVPTGACCTPASCSRRRGRRW